jgi:hypothetical protein
MFRRGIFLFFLLALFASSVVHAQIDLSTYTLSDTWQANQLNPAFGARFSGLQIGLPGVRNDLGLSNLTFNDFVRSESDGNYVDADVAIAQLDPLDNVLTERLDLETVGVGIGLGGFFVSLQHRLRYVAYVNFPQTLPQLIWQGNAQFIGQTIDFGPDFELNGYHEIALGGALPLGENLRLGARVKLLSGIANTSTSSSELRLTTGEDNYDLLVEGDYRVNASGALQYNGFEDLGLDFPFGRVSSDKLLGSNTGLAFDLGVDAQFGALELSASVLDLGGQIDWDKEVNNYTIDAARSYQGLDVVRDIFEDSLSFGGILDTLQREYEPTESSTAFSTELSTKYYFRIGYRLTEQLTIGGIFFGEQYRGAFDPAAALTGNYQVNNRLQVGALLAFRRDNFDNLGLNLAYRLGPLQLILATDNVITVFTPKNSTQTSLRVGASLNFGESRVD